MPEEETGLAVVERSFMLPDAARFKKKLDDIVAFQALCLKFLKSPHDFGVIPGTGDKPTLYKPGGEKVINLADCYADYDILERTADWGQGFFQYVVKCNVIWLDTRKPIAHGLGECNSFESKYRYRWLWENQLEEHGIDPEAPGMRTKTTRYGKTQYRVINQDPGDQFNTILKIAMKRAMIAGALAVGSLSDVWTQDLDDMDIAGMTIEHEPAVAPREESARSTAAAAWQWSAFGDKCKRLLGNQWVKKVGAFMGGAIESPSRKHMRDFADGHDIKGTDEFFSWVEHMAAEQPVEEDVVEARREMDAELDEVEKAGIVDAAPQPDAEAEQPRLAHTPMESESQ